MFVYRNRNTGDEVSYPTRSVRLDHLPNWSLVSQPPPPAPPPADPVEVPSGTIAEILAWVDGDRERAAQALAAEQAAASPRSSLIAQLTELAAENGGE